MWRTWVAVFAPVLRGWTVAMHSSICSVVNINVQLTKLFVSVSRLVRQGCPAFSFLCVLSLEPLLKKLGVLQEILFEPKRRKTPWVYADESPRPYRMHKKSW